MLLFLTHISSISPGHSVLSPCDRATAVPDLPAMEQTGGVWRETKPQAIGPRDTSSLKTARYKSHQGGFPMAVVGNKTDRARWWY
jgi:hypothetical protein